MNNTPDNNKVDYAYGAIINDATDSGEPMSAELLIGEACRLISTYPHNHKYVSAALHKALQRFRFL